MPKQTQEQKLIRTWWMKLLLALVFFGLAYGFVSLAIDSGSLWQYAIGIAFFVWAVRYILTDVKRAFHHR